jgi:hypothetical protein
MINFSNIGQIESLFSEMEPEDLAGEPFTPSLYQDDITLDERGQEYETEEEVTDVNEAKLGAFTTFTGSDIPVPLTAVDVGVIDLGITRTGFALAFKGAVILQELDGTHTVAKIGPRVKFITPDNRAEVLRFIGQALMDEGIFVEEQPNGELSIKAGAREPNQYKDRIRNFIERMLQLDVAYQLQNGIQLIEGCA